MKLGLDSYSTRNSGLDPLGVLDLAGSLGLEGVLFELSPFESFRDRDLQAVRDAAAAKGRYVHLGMGSLFGWHPMAEKGRRLLAEAGYDVSGSDAQIAIHHLHIARKLGSPLLRCVAGNLFTRDEGHDMAALADEAVKILREVCKAAEDLSIKVAVENHADFTVRELASILARVASPALGFTVDCANLAFDLDDPVRLAGIMAPYALTTHFLRTAEGLALENCSLADGQIDLVAIAAILARHNPAIHLNIEIHSQFAPFRLNILEAGFFDRHPAPPGDGLAWYLKQSWTKPILADGPANLADGPEAWSVEFEHLKQSVAWARHNLGHLLANEGAGD